MRLRRCPAAAPLPRTEAGSFRAPDSAQGHDREVRPLPQTHDRPDGTAATTGRSSSSQHHALSYLRRSDKFASPFVAFDSTSRVLPRRLDRPDSHRPPQAPAAVSARRRHRLWPVRSACSIRRRSAGSRSWPRGTAPAAATDSGQVWCSPQRACCCVNPVRIEFAIAIQKLHELGFWRNRIKPRNSGITSAGSCKRA